MNVLIVEDQLLVADYLSSIITEAQHTVIGTANNLENAIQFIGPELDLVLLDIFLANNDIGIDLSVTLHQANIPFLYITANNSATTLQLAAQSNPAGYISKPFNKTDVLAALAIAYNKLLSSKQCITIKSSKGNVKILQADVFYLESSSAYINIFTVDKMYVNRQTLKEFSQEVNNPIFLRIHRSYIINKQKVSSISASHLYLGNYKVPYSRSYKEAVDAIKLK